MKKSLSIIAGLATILAVSCTQEKLEGPAMAGEEVTVSFVAEAPQAIATKVFSDGQTAKNLYYAVYAEDNQTVLIQGETTFTDLKAQVELTLVTGKKYDIIFWAQKVGAPYTFDMAAQTVTADYSAVNANNEDLDAFYTLVDSYLVEGPTAEDVVLRRPFAQINVGTNDTALAAKAGYTATQTNMGVAMVPNVLNLHSGAVSGEATVNFAQADIPTGETFPVQGYDYLAMNYILAAADKTLTEVDFVIYGENEIPFHITNVPVQRNYRTNIYGALITNPTVWNVEINPAYEEPDYEVGVWNGVLEEVTPSAEGVYEVANGAQLAWVANEISTKEDFEFTTIKLTEDIYLGAEWTPIDLWNPESYNDLLIDGNGKTISGLKVKGGDEIGFIGKQASKGTLTIQNLTFDAPVVESSGKIVGTVVGSTYGSLKLDNVKVTGANISSTAEKGIRLGGLVGLYPADAVDPLVLNNCVVENSTIKGYHNLAGLVGSTMGSNAAMTGCQSNNNTFYPGAANAAAWQNFDANGYAEGKAVKEGCTTSGNKRAEEINGGGDEVEEAIKNGASELVLAAGTYTVPATAKGETLTFVGSGKPEDTVINCNANSGNGNFNGSNVTFENLTIASNGATYNGFTHVSGATYKNCIINNQLTLYNDGNEPLVFENCTFNVTGDSYNFWSWGANAVFTNCTFNCDGKAALVYGGTPESTVTFNSCTFNDNGGIDGKAAIETGDDYNSKYNVHINNCKVNGFEVTTPKKELGGDDLGTNVWGNKDRMTRDNLNVFINEVEVY